MPGLVPSAYGGKPGRKGLKPSRGCAGPAPQCVINAVNNNNECNYTFSANIPFNAITVLWNFGDDTTSTLRTPTHNYTQSGVFLVTLTIDEGLPTQKTCSIFVSCVFPCQYCDGEILPAEAFAQISAQGNGNPCSNAVAPLVDGVVVFTASGTCSWSFRVQVQCGACQVFEWSLQLTISGSTIQLTAFGGCEQGGGGEGDLATWTGSVGSNCIGSHVLTNPFPHGFLGIPQQITITI